MDTVLLNSLKTEQQCTYKIILNNSTFPVNLPDLKTKEPGNSITTLLHDDDWEFSVRPIDLRRKEFDGPSMYTFM